MGVSQSPDYYFNAYFGRRYMAHFVHKKRLDKIVSLVPDKSKVLDAGCGSGIVVFLLEKQKACTGVGIDIREECIKFATSKVPGFKFYQNDVREFSLGEHFNVVLCMEVLEHFIPTDQEKVIKCIDAHLEPGGLLLLTFPSRLYIFIEPIWKILRKWLHRTIVFDDDEYHSLVSPASILQILKQRGYVLERSLISGFGLIQMMIIRKK
jgi:2-polyprenyl-3-methyl-5-hydroxy-6-metoxy-1,4-benzoquinol methylase